MCGLFRVCSKLGYVFFRVGARFSDYNLPIFEYTNFSFRGTTSSWWVLFPVSGYNALVRDSVLPDVAAGAYRKSFRKLQTNNFEHTFFIFFPMANGDQSPSCFSSSCSHQRQPGHVGWINLQKLKMPAKHKAKPGPCTVFADQNSANLGRI